MEEARNGRKGRKEAATEEKKEREREMEIGGENCREGWWKGGIVGEESLGWRVEENEGLRKGET